MKLVVSLLAMALVFIGGYGLCQYGTTANRRIDSTTFYATIPSIEGNALLVAGLDVNDINDRGEFYLTVDEHTALKWRGTDISLSNLREHARVSITCLGPVLETYPGQISEVDQICILDDEI